MTIYLIFAATYLVLAIGRFPGLRIDRTGAAIIGAALTIGLGGMTVEEAHRAVDYDTILLLFGMMIVVANLRLAGFFALVTEWVLARAHHRLAMLAGIVAVSGTLSAFFVNDTICLVMTPLVVEIVVAMEARPAPYLLAVAMASNVGSAATLTGNPQNMMIAGLSGIPYRTFTAAMAPVAAVGLALTFAVLALLYRGEFRKRGRIEPPGRRPRVHRMLLAKSLAAAGAMVAMFFAGWPIAPVALLCGAALLITRRVKPERVYRQIDWQLLALFAGLFIVVAGIEKTPLPGRLFAAAEAFGLERVGPMSAFAALLSNVLSNVPAVLLFKTFVPQLADPERAWMALSMASTLAGNLTILGSVANLIVVERARGAVRIGFWEYARAGAPLTLLTIAFGAWWLGRV